MLQNGVQREKWLVRVLSQPSISHNQQISCTRRSMDKSPYGTSIDTKIVTRGQVFVELALVEGGECLD